MDLRATIRLIRKLSAELGPEVNLRQIAMFLEVADFELDRKEELEQFEAGNRLGMKSSTASHTVAVLMDFARPRKAGLGVVEQVFHSHDRRKRWLKLTPKGRRIIKETMN